MKSKVLLSIMCVLTAVAVLTSCSKPKADVNKAEITTHAKEEKEYKKVDSKLGYEAQYDDVLFSSSSQKSEDKLVSNTPDNDETGLSITKVTDKTADEVANEYKEKYEKNGYTSVSIDDAIVNKYPAIGVGGFSEDGTRIYECDIVDNNGELYVIEYSFSTESNALNEENAIMATLNSFTLK